MKFNASIDIAITISLVGFFLFANGQAYLGGYLGTFGVDPVLLNFSIQDKLYIGYLKGFAYLNYAVYVLVGCIILHYGIYSLDIPRKLNGFWAKKLHKLKPTNHSVHIHNSSFYDNLDSNYGKHSFILIMLLVLLISTLFLLAHSEKTAKQNAYNDLKNFDFRQVHLKSDPQNQNFFIVKCGSNYCALINKQKQITLEEPKNLIFSIRKKEGS
ncbi:hypothetical protein [Acinetobacter ursingii]|uniref:hypothetical protein n=1 Tax=Acinetobacter ursingii TaxID=108980 RepID=UPI0021CD6B53|nr:hypothetical protein [Acinetobacter ursingii]MCU4481361.1 hypothetical protein [Acinetobacter ursingii]MCU4505693.1 hypothetical protein [Acinetobacter ursingii]MCU4569639.1 hypothetical protein [Acinetobacter ursingii]